MARLNLRDDRLERGAAWAVVEFESGVQWRHWTLPAGERNAASGWRCGKSFLAEAGVFPRWMRGDKQTPVFPVSFRTGSRQRIDFA